jgi:hypothetical protein
MKYFIDATCPEDIVVMRQPENRELYPDSVWLNHDGKWEDSPYYERNRTEYNKFLKRTTFNSVRWALSVLYKAEGKKIKKEIITDF